MADKKVPYQVNGRQFEGMIVYDDSVNAKRPAIFMQPDWKGVCGDTIAQARTVAGKDYVVLMADMFGLGYGDKPKTPQELMAGMHAVHDDFAGQWQKSKDPAFMYDLYVVNNAMDSSVPVTASLRAL